MNALNEQKVILITGPAGSGKTATAEIIAKNKDWVHLSEDDFWVDLKQGHPVGESRTPEEEHIIQFKALKRMSALLDQGKNVVFEFILFHNPPTPLIFYQEELLRRNINLVIKVLKPDLETILKRQKLRGRSNDSNIAAARLHAIHQLECLVSPYIQPDWMIDNSDLNLETVYKSYFLPIIES